MFILCKEIRSVNTNFTRRRKEEMVKRFHHTAHLANNLIKLY